MTQQERAKYRDKKLILIDRFLEGRGYELISKRYPDGVVFLLVPKFDRVYYKSKFPNQLFRDLLAYQKDKVIKRGEINCGRGDCFSVAVKVHTDLFFDKAKSGGSGTLYIGDGGKELPFFGGSGFQNHVVNFFTFA